MSTLKVNNLDTESGTTVTVTTGKTVSVPSGATLDVAGTATLTNATLALPATLPATALTNATNIPAAQLSGQVPTANLGNVDFGPTEDDIAVLGFQVAAASDLAQYNLRDQIVDTFQDASGIDASASTNEERDTTGKYWYGGVSPTVTGGTITTDGLFTIHKFTASGNYISDTAQDVEYLVIAGGGAGGDGGGSNSGGGGGAGGYMAGTSFPVSAATHAVTVGAGGVRADGVVGPSGQASIFSTITASGGGGGGSQNASSSGVAGGSGGGGSYATGSGGAASPAGQGNAGGTVVANSGASAAAAGGGGAGAAGGGAVQNTSPGDLAAVGVGGVGLANDILVEGTPVYYAGGGTGSAYTTASQPGGQGGGGAGGAAGTANTGGGGGGGHDGGTARQSGSGGSGIVIIRRPTAIAGSNMTLVSTATTAEAGTTDTGDVVMLYTPSTGTTTLNTDLKAYVSRDNGTTYTQATLVGKGSYSGTTQIASVHNLDISGQPAGVAMRWKVETLNQSAGVKETRVNGMSLGWS